MRPGEDVVQLCGEENCGKTELLFNVIADAILPDQWNNIKLPGRNLSTIFISADYKFDILRLVCVMENKLKEALQKQNPKFKKSLPSIVVQKSIVTSSLERCHVFKTSSGDELLSTIEWMPKFLQRNLNVSIIAIDNVAAYYWMERSKYGLAEYESRQKCLVNGLKKLKEGYRIVILYTVPSLMSSSKDTNPSSFLPRCWQRFTTHQYMLRPSPDSSQLQSPPSLQPSAHNIPTNVYVACKLSDRSCHRYYITDSGVHFLL